MQEIFIFEDSQQSKSGGGQKVTATFVDYLKKRSDISITICDTLKKSESSFQQFENVGFFKYWRPKMTPARIGSSFTFSYIQTALIVVAAVWAGFSISRLIFLRFNRAPPILYCPTKFGYFAALLPALTLSCKIVMHVHNISENSSISRIFYWLLRMTVDEVVCVSQTVYDSVDHPRKTLIRNPIPSLSRIVRVPRKECLSLGVVASFFPYKGHRFFLDVAEKIVANHPKVNVHFYGDGPELNGLAKRFISKEFHFHGRISDLDEIYLNLDVVVIPSLKPEAFSIVIPEAWSYGCLVLASDAPAHKELINDGVNGHLFVTADSENLYNLLDSIIKDWTSQAYRISDGYASLEQFKIADFGPQLLKILSK